MGRKKWQVASYDRELVADVAERNNIDPFAALLLVARGITSEAEVRAFQSKRLDFCDPFDLVDMEAAVECIGDALDSGEKIAVYGDYDADGITATALLYTYLLSQGADVISYIPDRNTEGYGMNIAAVEKLNEQGVRLIITVDNGINAYGEAQRIAELGMKLVVTDHHKVGSKLPVAQAVVDPHRSDCTCGFRDWSGVGVAFKLICALEGDDGSALAEEYADLVAIGTIADIVPLTGENRTLVKKGLRLINASHNSGVASLRDVAGVAERSINATTVAFSIVPRINAIGRMGRVQTAFELLVKGEGARECAEKLSESNLQRQQTENEIMKQAMAQLRENPSLMYDRVLVLSGEGWHGGVIGIVAARLAERFGRPAIVIARDGEKAKGSGRSLEGFSLYDAINSAAHLLTHFGGHTLAAGFSLCSSDIAEFRKTVNDYARTVEMPFPRVNIDCRLRPDFLTVELLDVLEALEPFGAGNPQPMFGLFGMTLTAIQPVGNGKHLRLTLTKDGHTVTAMRFGVSAQQLGYVCGDKVDLAARLEKNEYRGETRLSIHIKEIRPAGSNDEVFLKGQRLFESIMRGNLPKNTSEAYPSRELCAALYRFLKQNGGYCGDTDVLCLRLGDDGSSSCKISVAIEAMVELGLLVRNEDSSIALAETKGKVELESAAILKRLRGCGKENGYV